MKKLISSLAELSFSAIAQQFPEAPMCFYALKTVLSSFLIQNGYKTYLAMDMRTHGCSFTTDKRIVITKVGYKAWKPGLAYRISLWQVGKTHSLSTCLISPQNTTAVEFFPLNRPVSIAAGKIYYITRTYIEDCTEDRLSDSVGWLNSKDNGVIYPVKEQAVTLIDGFFSDDVNPLQSDRMSNIQTKALLPLIDFEYSLEYQ